MSEWAIGIDSGGSFVDIVLTDDGAVVWEKKFPSLSRNFDGELSRALQEAACAAGGGARITHAAFCTTLATNALVNGTFRPAALFLIGYSDALVRAVKEQTIHIPELSIVCVDGGHDRDGRERRPLDAAAVAFAAERMPRTMRGVGISSFYSVRDPSHEIEAKRIVTEIRDVPCVCGSELSNGLNAVRRAVTCGSSASLIPIAKSVIDSVEAAMADAGIPGPLHVMRGDGCLMNAKTASLQPIQMLLSGPAASAIGADELFKLSGESGGEKRYFSLDMGGTTTDIVEIAGGRFRAVSEGGSVGGFRTMVKTADVRTVGLGGDSAVRCAAGGITVGPDRVVPIAELPRLCDGDVREMIRGSAGIVPCFVVPGETFDDGSRDVFLDHVARVGAEEWGRMLAIVNDERYSASILAAHERAGRIRRCSFTPTDACIVLGTLGADRAASEAAADIVASRLDDSTIANGRDFASAVKRAASESLARALLRFVMERAGFSEQMLDSRDGSTLIDAALNKGDRPGEFGISVMSMPRVVFLGAPARSFADELGDLARTECLVFEHGALGGAVGAALARRRTPFAVSVRSIRDKGVFRAHMPFGTADFDDMESAVRYAEEKMTAYVAAQTGCEDVAVEREDIAAEFGPRAGCMARLVFGCDLTFVAR